MKQMSAVVAEHQGSFTPFTQSTIMNRVPKAFRKGVCSGASAIFLYLSALRHSSGDDSLYRYMKTLEDFVSQNAGYVEMGLNISATQQQWIEGFKQKPRQELLAQLETFKTARFKLDYKDLAPRSRKQERLDMFVKPTAAEKKQIVKAKKSGGERSEILSFPSYVQFRPIDRIVELQKIMIEKDSLPRGPFDDANIRANEEQLSLLSGKKIKRIDGDGDGFLLFSPDRIASLFTHNGCYIVSTPEHAHAAYLNDAASPARFEYFEPNFGIASFKQKAQFTAFMADWLLTSDRYKGHIDIDRYSL